MPAMHLSVVHLLRIVKINVRPGIRFGSFPAAARTGRYIRPDPKFVGSRFTPTAWAMGSGLYRRATLISQE